MADKRARKKQPATPEQRAALQFEPIRESFNWSNEDWALAYLPMVRAAIVLLSKDREELADCIREYLGGRHQHRDARRYDRNQRSPQSARGTDR